MLVSELKFHLDNMMIIKISIKHHLRLSKWNSNLNWRMAHKHKTASKFHSLVNGKYRTWFTGQQSIINHFPLYSNRKPELKMKIVKKKKRRVGRYLLGSIITRRNSKDIAVKWHIHCLLNFPNEGAAWASIANHANTQNQSQCKETLHNTHFVLLKTRDPGSPIYYSNALSNLYDNKYY